MARAGMNNFEALGELEQLLEAMSYKLKPSVRKSFLTKAGRDIRRSQMMRIAAQKNPDGTKYAPRKKKQQMRQTLRAAHFLYPVSGSNQPRIVFMKSWLYLGKRFITGFDIEVNGMRTFRRDKIVRWLPVPAGQENANAGGFKRLSVRQKAMFKRIKGPRWLKSWASEDELSVGFRGSVVKIADSHQFGVKHPQRELLGMSKADTDALMDMIVMGFDPR